MLQGVILVPVKRLARGECSDGQGGLGVVPAVS